MTDEASNPASAFLEREFADGYRDGRDLECPEPGKNRSQAYRHSWNVGRAERLETPIPAYVSRRIARAIEAAELGLSQ